MEVTEVFSEKLLEGKLNIYLFRDLPVYKLDNGLLMSEDFRVKLTETEASTIPPACVLRQEGDL